MAISIADSSCSPTRPLDLLPEQPQKFPPRKQSMWQRLGLRRLLGRDDRDSASHSPASSGTSSPSHQRQHHHSHSHTNNSSSFSASKFHDHLSRKLSKRVGVALPRSTTFKRQDSERRDRLAPANPEPRRAQSADRRRPLSAQRTRSPQPAVGPRLSAPEVQWCEEEAAETTVDEPPETNDDSDLRSEWNPGPDVTDAPEEQPADEMIEMELDKRWILNLSMHFRDRSEREKFFVTYAEAPNRWRRVTISCDYRNATPDSLEQDLKELRYQRDKCSRIYESIRESLLDIQFYDTVTNLKLETRDGRLHVHVTEDVNEIIPYPPVSCVGHLPNARLVPENRLHFDAHLSGFVYNVRLGGRNFIKKEIPGPDTVDEFLYEINALNALNGAPSVIQVQGIVVDDREEVVKGLLIEYAEQGALVDILYENRGEITWERRERWAKQIIQGLCEIHESGYVQGDFTLSNIVVDANDNAKIIDINRRGCPVGWEPPEIAAKIESNQRISMYIGVKTDLYQLGMTLWALAMQEDEPERQCRPLLLDEDAKVPDYYRRLVDICLSPNPRHRLSAKELLGFFPRELPMEQPIPLMIRPQPHHIHSSIGVGLRNGFLPLQNARAIPASVAFANSHDLDDGYSMSQYHPNLAAAPPYLERNSGMSLEADEFRPRTAETMDDSRIRAFSVDSNPPARLDLDELDDQPGFSESISQALRPDNLGDTQNLTSQSNPHEIDLDATIHPLFRNSTDQEAGLPPFRDALPGELAGVGGHPACSLNQNPTDNPSPDSVKYQESPLSSASTQSTEPYPPPVTDLGQAYMPTEDATYPDWSTQVPSHSVSSLLHSILPINPALSPSEQKLISTNPNPFHSPLTIRSALNYPRPGFQSHSPYLSDSHLPINPAFSDKALPSL
ncbi:hypothetical protein ASPWEDRAFT_117939 [Aspergillus wentii DTO 134E9]|uniref:Protein kinase domain-containing protein n=1 Tax=Aspergillus wentii DTO 134E9 TaxID=1073089 RepID=A0A1L9RBJ9_ASPWE|nr:uncharacterized protein ASPWEDRAFT_117939 [Aspergillus wentii DTO 134E9]OJJ32306.1 hypothetical protein ASPWEDRAFT_117939 [Aspergillus wentii DTO 134E9]